MALRLGDVAPDFTAKTTQGELSLHEYLGDSWGILFSHPADFTPVCTTELGEFANRKAEFDRRGTKLIGVSVDSVESHERWSSDIEETQGSALNYPLVGDEDRNVAERRVEGAAKYLRSHGLEVSVAPVTTSVHPAEVLRIQIAQCETATMVMGAYGNRGLREMLFGSTTNPIVENPPCPLFLYR